MKKWLKLLLIGLVWLFGGLSFCSAWTFTYNWTIGDNSIMLIPQKPLSSNVSVHCDFVSSSSSCEWQFKWSLSYMYWSLTTPYWNSTSQSSWNFISCSEGSSFDADLSNFEPPSWASPVLWVVSFNITSNWVPDWVIVNYSCIFSWDSVYSPWLSCPEVNTWEILSWYILESEIDTNFCVGNWYCPTNECTGSLDPVQSWNWSSLFINDIQHIGAWLINITIPEEIEWDYIYTWNWDEFDLNVKWYNVDSDYIEGIINTQNSKPSSQDFNNIITWLIPLFVPWLCIILLLYFIYLFIKKIF